MKANELMIGDWVVYEGDTNYDNPIRIEGMDIATKSLITSDREDVGFDGIEPIPLTAEILEKNGFVEQEYGWRMLNATNWCININIFNGKERYALSVLGINAQVTLHGYYVHELQHALRLCGIDKEIVL